VRELVAAALRAAQPPAKVDLTGILREIDPSWSGRKPRFGPPIALRAADGRNPVDGLMDEERER
jgi:hypothetical protein